MMVSRGYSWPFNTGCILYFKRNFAESMFGKDDLNCFGCSTWQKCQKFNHVINSVIEKVISDTNMLDLLCFSGSILGGVIGTLSYFYNHGEVSCSILVYISWYILWSGSNLLLVNCFCLVHQSYVDATTERKFFISVSCFSTTGCYPDHQVCESSLHLINSRLNIQCSFQSHMLTPPITKSYTSLILYTCAAWPVSCDHIMWTWFKLIADQVLGFDWITGSSEGHCLVLF